MVGAETNTKLDDSRPLEAFEAQHASSHPGGAAKRSLFTEYFLYLSGVTGVGLGAALLVAPPQVPELGWVAKRLADFGVEPSSMVFTGILLFAMGMVARTFARSAASAQAPAMESPSDADFMLVADQLATDMAQSLSTLLQISSEIAELSENNRTLLRNMPDTNGQATANQTPIFRLAASVDQLCANVDSRLASLGQEMSSSMQGVSSSLGMVQGELEKAAQHQAQAPAPAPVAAPQESPLAPLEAAQPMEDLQADAPAALPHPMDAAAPMAAEQLDLAEPSSDFENPALDLFDKMEEHHDQASEPAAPFHSDLGIDPLDDLMPNQPNPPKPDLGI